eukprot:TRINITY_DN11480_c0_g2_i1.p1 TRINITY_DN11480_c0_g2~~TRINITY_DN11480_c0_g2_i1.p1  ORF type:complete len:314 (-),score=74.95 TRINITY_DN11480_c0_g2_i1:34-975(-)
MSEITKTSAGKKKTEIDYLTYEPDKTKSLLNFKKNLLFKVLQTVRVIGTYSFSLLLVLVLWGLLPLSLLHKPLRKLGIKNKNLPMNIASRWYAKGCILMSGISVVEKQGGVKGPTILVSNHLSKLDPFMAMAFCDQEAIKFIFKQELLWQAPWLMPLGYLLGHIPVDRKNREKAIKQLNKAVSHISDSKTIIIYPEGTRSVSGKLQQFKKGPFHLSYDSGVPITPMIVTGPWHCWKPHTFFPLPGTVRIKILDQIQVENKTVEELLLETRTIMANALDEDDFVVKPINQIKATIPSFLFLTSISVLVYWKFFT